MKKKSEKKSLLNSSWIISLILIGFAILIGVGSSLFIKSESAAGLLSGILAPLLTGYLYASRLRKVMPKSLRIRSSGIYILFQIIFAFLYLLFFPGTGFSFGVLILFLFAAIVIGGIVGAFTYWFLGFSSKIYVDAIEKKKKKG